jgi:hypothetical protein
MLPVTMLKKFVNPLEFMVKALKATTSAHIEALLASLPITSEHDYSYDDEHPDKGWIEGNFHWIPVGRERGNAGRIKQANFPVNPIAERTVNGMEALIEMLRQRELLTTPDLAAPENPRAAVRRYFNLPPLDQLPKLETADAKEIRKHARELARLLRVRVVYDKPTKAFTVAIEDDGIGQTPEMIHRTLLSLGSTSKADKWYLIGVFGQGGSSAYAVSQYSWVVSRRAPDLLGNLEDGAGWTVVKHVFPKNRRDDYFAYLACSPDGRVPFVDGDTASKALITHGTRFVHINYDFGKGGSTVTRQLFQTMNHVLYNPILPFDLDVSGTLATVYGNGYRLSSLGTKTTKAAVLDKIFPPLPVGV